MTDDLHTPHIVVFGRPGAGKSSLLGAFLQAARTQHEVLRADVLDSSQGLAGLRDRVYAGGAKSTDAELVPYPVRLKPWRTAGAAAEVPPAAVFYDCDGDRAAKLLERPGALAKGEPRGELARAVEDADALVLVVNAAATEAELGEAFAAFGKFLDALEAGRTFTRDVGGLPVFLALSQCDRLRHPGDDTAAWEARIADRKRHVLQRFADYFEDDDRSPYLSFGSVDLRVGATAVRRPALADHPAGGDEPYGVAELFRDCLAAARDHRERQLRSAGRLKWTVGGAGGVVGLLAAGLLAVLTVGQPVGDPSLPSRVRAYQAREGPAGERLADKNLPGNQRELAAVRSDAGFENLPADLRGFVENRLREFEDYKAYRAKLAAPRPVPADARSLDELAKIEATLTGELAPPPDYPWGDTDAVRLRDKWLADATAIRDAETRLTDWYRGLIRRATGMVFTPTFDAGWRADAEALVAEGAKQPATLADLLPGSTLLPGPRGEAVTYAIPTEFDRVDTARRDWDYARDQVIHLRDLADALGLTAGPNRPEAVLAIPEPMMGTDSAKLGSERWQAVQKQFQDRAATEGGPYSAMTVGAALRGGPSAASAWELRNFPDPARAELERHVRRSFDNGVRHVHRLLLAKLGPKANDTPAGWRRVADALGEPAFQDWGRLLHLLARLTDPKAANPVAELEAFLRADHFDLTPKGFDLSIPVDLRDQRVTPAGKLTVRLTPQGGAAPLTLTFRQDGEGRRQGSATVYRFLPEGDPRLTYRPGDGLTADLPVRAGPQEYQMTWTTGRTATFQFDPLTGEPRLLRGPTGEPATGVRLTPEAGWPTVPVLLPPL